MRRSRIAVAVTLTMLAGPALSGCLGDVEVPTPSITATSAEPSPSASATASPSATAAPSTESPNDPGDGVATDPPVTTPTPEAGEEQATVRVALTRYGSAGDQFQAAAVVSGIVESTGACTMTLTRDGDTRTATGVGTPSATTTNCGEGLSIPLSSLSSGTWTLVISYESEGYRGSSNPVQVSIS